MHFFTLLGFGISACFALVLLWLIFAVLAGYSLQLGVKRRLRYLSEDELRKLRHLIEREEMVRQE